MRTLSSALSTALAAPVQQPAILVEVGFSTPSRWSSFATLAWNGYTWMKEAIEVQGLAVQALTVSGSLVIGNGDDVAAALVLNEGVADRPIRIWGYDAAATALGDVVLLADAVGAAATIATDAVTITLRAPNEFTLAPRTFVNYAAGFAHLLPAGTVLKINGAAYKLGGR